MRQGEGRDDAASAEARIASLDAAARHHDPVHDGRRVRWREWGSGPPLVLVHGGHGSWLHWVSVIEPLAARFRLWVPDLPGYGDSDDLAGHPHDPDRQRRSVALVAGTWRQLIAAEAEPGLVGFSFGGLVCGALAASGQVGVRRLALLGTAGHRTTRRPMAPLIDWRLSDPIAARAALRRNLATFMLHRESAVDALALLAHERSSRRTRYRSRQMSLGIDLRDVIDAYDGPVRMIWGAEDVTCADPAGAGRRLAASRPGRDWHVVDGAGHWVQQEAPAPTLRLLFDWFA